MGDSGIRQDKSIEFVVTVNGIMKAVWDFRLVFLGVISFSALIGVVFALSLPNYYISDAVLVPAEVDGNNSNLGSMIGLSGVAKLAGISSSSSGGRQGLALEVLKSRNFLLGFIKRHSLERELLAIQGFDPVTFESLVDPDIYDVSSGEWVKYGSDSEEISDEGYYQALKELKKRLAIDTDDSGRVSISYESLNPKQAMQVLSVLLVDIDENIKIYDRRKSQHKVDFLNGEITKTSVGELRQVLLSLLEAQMQRIILTNVDSAYVFDVVDPPYVPMRKSGPPRALIVVSFLVLGGSLCGVISLIICAIRQRKGG